MDAALRYLSRKARTTAEMRSHLARRGYDVSAVNGALARLAELGYLDDAAYAVRYATWSATEKPMGRRRVSGDLARKGVASDVIEHALDEALGPEAESAALAKAMARATRGVQGRPDERSRRRLASHLLRRGFRTSMVMDAVEAWSRSFGGEEEGEVFDS